MLDQPGIFTYRDAVAVIQLFFFIIYLVLGFVISWRHGFRRSDGWVILITFSILRLVGASFQLVSITHPIKSVYAGAITCEGIGLAPLVLLNIGIFSRLDKFLNTSRKRLFSLISLVATVGIGLGIWGSIKSENSATLATNNLLKIAIILFGASYVAFLWLFLIFLGRWKGIPHGERRLLLCFLYGVPFMAARFLYSILGTFVPRLRSEYSPLTGNVTVFLCMAVIEEIFVVAFFVITGMTLERLPPALR